MDPQGPSQPTLQTAYNQSQNPVSQTASEINKVQPIPNSLQATDSTTTTTDATSLPSSSSAEQQAIDHRRPHDVPSTHAANPTPSSLGYGSTGPLTEKPTPASDAQQYSKSELDGEQMRAPGEGDVADAVTGKKYGGHSEQASLTENIREKSEQHREALHERGIQTQAEMQETAGERAGYGVLDGSADGTSLSSPSSSPSTIRKTAAGGEVDLGKALGGRDAGVVLTQNK